MNYQFSVFEIIVLFGILQGLIIAILIWKNKPKSKSKLFLSLVLITFVLLSAKMLLLTTKLNHHPYIRYFPRSFELLIQPLIWLYISSLVIVEFKFEKKYWLHFIPFALFFGYSIFVYFATFGIQGMVNQDLLANSLYYNKVKKFEDFLSIASSIVYWVLGCIKLIRYRKWLNEQTSNTDFPTYSWVKNISILMGLLILILSIDILVDSFLGFKIHLIAHWKLFFIYIAGVVYYMGFKGYTIPDGSAYLSQLAIQQQNSTANFSNTIHKINSKEPLSADQLLDIEQKILEALNGSKIYLDPELSLQKMAMELQTSEINLSAVINNKLQKTFRTLINEHRVEAVKQKLIDPRSSNLSILGIAYQCGFNSEASFYRIFKLTTGLSPKAYMEGNK
jgi:AraC-like DNA-binding protein